MDRPIGVFVGRCQPLHNGHREIINRMIEDCGIENSIVILGSMNAPNTAHNPFSFDQRRAMIKKVWPHLVVTGVEDYPTDEEWIKVLGMCLNFVFVDEDWDEFTGYHLYCGDDSYVGKLFKRIGKVKEVLNRDDLDISGTEVRLELLQPRKLPFLLQMVPAQIHEGLQEMFDEQLNERLNRELRGEMI